MKKIVLLSLFVAFSSVIFAQVTFKPGVRAGLNLASITDTNDGSRADYYAGIFAELKLGKLYALQPEITYSKQGSRNIELDYMSIHFTNKFYILKDKLPVYALIGPGFDVNLHGDTGSYSNSYSTGYSTGVTFEADFSFHAGVGYDFPFGLGVEARYKHGIIDVLGNNEPPFEGKLNNVIQLGVLYKFNFSKKED